MPSLPFLPYLSKDFVIEGNLLRLESKEEAWNGIDGRMRTEIRRAKESSVEIRKLKGTEEELQEFRTFCLNPEDIPERLTDRYHFFGAFLEGKFIAGIIVVDCGWKLFMLCHASQDTAKEHGIPSLLIWHVVEEFAGSKFRFFDIGASYRPSLQKYFAGWKTNGYPIIMRPPEIKLSLNLTPFDTQALEVPTIPNAKEIVTKALKKKWDEKPFTFFPRGMYAIFTLFKFLKEEGRLKEGQDVWITTTTDTHYISSCVTSAIEKILPWTRTLTQNTGAIFAIHEFGFPHPKLAELRRLADKRGIPLIEDCAYGWGTEGIGSIGDYALYSLTKAFPVQFGGYLVGHMFSHEDLWKRFGCSDCGKEEFTMARLAHYIQEQEQSFVLRREHYRWYEVLFGIDRTYFPLADTVEPGAYVLCTESEERMQEVSAFVLTFGIECGNYWKNSAIILPCHQRLAPAHREYIAGAVLATEREWCGVPRPQ